MTTARVHLSSAMRTASVGDHHQWKIDLAILRLDLERRFVNDRVDIVDVHRALPLAFELAKSHLRSFDPCGDAAVPSTIPRRCALMRVVVAKLFRTAFASPLGSLLGRVRGRVGRVIAFRFGDRLADEERLAHRHRGAEKRPHPC